MSGRRGQLRIPLLPGARSRALDRAEVARFLRPQPPRTIPRHTFLPLVPGLIARTLLGHRVIRPS
jgi:hypothetical protein